VTVKNIRKDLGKKFQDLLKKQKVGK